MFIDITEFKRNT